MEPAADDGLRLQRDPPEGWRAWHVARRHLRLPGGPDGCGGNRLSRISASGVDPVLGPWAATRRPSARVSHTHVEDFADVILLVAPVQLSLAMLCADDRVVVCGMVAIGLRRAGSRFRPGFGRGDRQGL